MSSAKGVSTVLHPQEFGTLASAGLLERCRFAERHRLVGRAMNDEPGHRDLPSRRRDVQAVGILLDIVEHIRIKGQDLAGPRILNFQVSCTSPRTALIGRPPVHS